MNKKTVLLLVPSLGVGGQERIALNTAECLSEHYDVRLAIFQKKDIEYECQYPVFNLDVPTKAGFWAKVLNQLKRIIKVARLRRAIGADVVMSFGSTANITNAISGLIAPGKSVSAIHGFAEVEKSLSMRSIIGFSDKIVCIAKAMQEKVLNLFPKCKKTLVIENGYDIDKIIEKSNDNIDVVFKHPAIIAMGRLEHVKGFDRLIKAFAKAKQNCSELNLYILGQGTLNDELINLATLTGVSDCVHFLGYRENPYAYIAKSDMFVMSSRNEGFPNALIETLACEIPIISVDCLSGPREILSAEYSSAPVSGVKEEKYGVLVEENSDDETTISLLADAIEMMSCSADKANEYRMHGRKRANQFSKEVYSNKITALIEELLFGEKSEK